ncbi:hypothetical protein ACFOYU_11800 [Microvirga sp. GCM10011540]|uniref:hypothetical protein n=1 Tax=Microvirga sp. GCM10011540 TaxID=3317338 RepID=UPI003605F909
MAVVLNDIVPKAELAKDLTALLDTMRRTEEFIASKPNRKQAKRWLIGNASRVIALWPVMVGGRMAVELEIVRDNPNGNGMVAVFPVADEAGCDRMVRRYGDRQATSRIRRAA